MVSYEYESNNGNLLKVLYGNGDYLRYDYDRQDRISITWFYSAAEKAEKKLYSYVYNKQGELARVTDQTLGKTYWLYYDFLGRLMRVVDMKDSCSYEYHYDAGNNMVSLRHSAEATFQTNYVYDKDSREQKVTTFGHTRTTHYDNYGRISQQVWNEGAAGQHKTIYTYMDSGNNRYSLVKEIMVGGKSTFYKYDENGNIIQISEGTAGAEGKTSTFKYDKRNQLIREDNHLLNKTFAYAYDLGGNMTRMEEYAFTKADKALPSTPVKTVRGTFDSTWKDQLLTWNGVSMTYDAIGNMVKKGNTTYTWTQGRKLSTVNNGKKIQYFYDHTGRRVRKTVDGVTTDFRMAGELLMSQKAGDVTTYFSYDSAGNLIGMSAGRERYFYTRNAQNDITGLIDENGTSVVQYQYDSWGKLLGITGSFASTIGKRNPFRYRGYYYDDETGMYYLQSRYYDSEIKRFICADKYASTGLNLCACNMYVYCYNNPILFRDKSGTRPIAGTTLTGETDREREISIAYVKGLPNSKEIFLNPDGTIKKERWYGPDGEAIRDRDYNHSGKMPFPHDHEWKNGKRGTEHLPPSPDYEFSVEPVIGAAIVVLGVIGMGIIAVDNVTGIGTVDDGLAGLITTGIGKGLMMMFG